MESSLEFSSSLGSVSSLISRCRTFKVLVIGDSGVGKTCLTHRLCAGEFLRRTEATIGVDFRERALEVDGEKIKAYKTVNGDTERYEDRLANMRSEEKAEVTSEAASSLPAESAPAEDEPAPGAEITPEPVPASPEPAAETSAEPTAEASPEEPAAAEASEADVAEAPAEPADAEGAPVAVEETAAEVGSEVAAVTPAEDAAAEESAGMAAVDEAPPALPANAETPAEAPEPEAVHAAEVAA